MVGTLIGGTSAITPLPQTWRTAIPDQKQCQATIGSLMPITQNTRMSVGLALRLLGVPFVITTAVDLLLHGPHKPIGA